MFNDFMEPNSKAKVVLNYKRECPNRSQNKLPGKFLNVFKIKFGYLKTSGGGKFEGQPPKG